MQHAPFPLTRNRRFFRCAESSLRAELRAPCILYISNNLIM